MNQYVKELEVMFLEHPNFKNRMFLRPRKLSLRRHERFPKPYLLGWSAHRVFDSCKNKIGRKDYYPMVINLSLSRIRTETVE